MVRGAARRGARAGRRRRGLRPVRRLDGARHGARGRAARRRAHVLQDVEHGGGPARLPRRSVVAGAPPRRRRAAVPPRRGQAGGRPARPRATSTRWTSGSRRSSPSASGSSRALGRTARRDVPERRQLRAVPRHAAATRARRCGRASSTAACSCATARGWPRLDGCLRVTIGTPTENDRFLAALARGAAHERAVGTRSRTTKETSIEISIDLDGTGVTDVLDRHPVLRPHARPARPSRRLRPDRQGHRRPRHRHPPHRRGRRHRARRGVPRRARRQGRHPALRQRACSRSTRR